MRLEIVLGGLLCIAMYVIYRLGISIGKKETEKKVLKQNLDAQVYVSQTYDLAMERMEKRVEKFEKALQSIDISTISDDELNRLWHTSAPDTELPTHPESDQKSKAK